MFIIGRVTNILLWYDWLEHANIATSNQNAIFQNNVGLLGVGDKTDIAYFNRGHEIDGVATFAFLAKHLDWPRGAKPLVIKK